MKQETLKEVAEKFYNDRTDRLPSPTSHWIRSKDLQIDCFIKGAEWKQDKMYSEEDMKFAYEQGARLALISQSPLARHKGKFPTPDEWFEQFKY